VVPTSPHLQYTNILKCSSSLYKMA
jgi:hypothetical protein